MACTVVKGFGKKRNETLSVKAFLAVAARFATTAPNSSAQNATLF
jgi:hypothetical protein